MTGQSEHLIRRIYISYIFLLIAFAVFAYFYQLNINKMEDKKTASSGDIAVIQEKIDTAIENHAKGPVLETGFFEIRIGQFGSSKEAEGFFNSQKKNITEDLRNAYEIRYERNNSFYSIVLGQCESKEKAEILGERLMKHFNLKHYEVVEK